ncbi:hypothetical protein C4J91_3680 [Pseudomonas sp. R3-52-08]|nr:hypothetical protein C4J91_3680 [Pseudomonas sp. R3-52-08]
MACEEPGKSMWAGGALYRFFMTRRRDGLPVIFAVHIEFIGADLSHLKLSHLKHSLAFQPFNLKDRP